MVCAWWVALQAALKAAAGAAMKGKGLVGAVKAAGTSVGGKVGTAIEYGGKALEAAQSMGGGGGDEPANQGGSARPAPSSQIRADPLASQIGMQPRIGLEQPQSVADIGGPTLEEMRRRRFERQIGRF